MFKIHYGNAVAGTQRFPRPQLEAKLMRALENSGGVKMFGLRRIGKSTLRRYAIEQLQETGREVVFIDAQGLHSVADLLAELLPALSKQSPSLSTRILSLITKESPIRGLLEGIAKASAIGENTVAAYWREAYNAIRDALELTEIGAPVLVIDEFSLLLQNMLERAPDNGVNSTNHLLAAMREWRDKGMKMLLTGSIGISALARRYGLSNDHLNDLLAFDVPELSEAEAREFVTQAAQSCGSAWGTPHTEEFLKQSGVLYPSFLVKGLLALGMESPPSPDEMAEIFARQIRPLLHDDFYNQFNKRFRFYQQIDPTCRAAIIVPALQRVMASNSAVSLEDMAPPEPYSRIDLAQFLDILVEDGFLSFWENVEGERLWLPASRLVRLWWKRAKLV